jgi:Ca-activated chloride channel homolog
VLDLFDKITFANKELFWLMLVIPAMIAWYIWKQAKSNADIKISSLKAFGDIKTPLRARLRHSLFVLRLLAVALLIVVLARPQSIGNMTKEGIDIILALDISPSMLAQDFKPNRLDVTKEVAQNFIDKRPNDRIGLVIFSGESFTQCPLTTDHIVLKNMIASIKPGTLIGGTAIGMGLATSVSRLKDSKAKSRVIILMTDGVNNAGTVAPLTAAEIAQTFGLRVYTIGAGTRGKALSPVRIYPNGAYLYDYVDVEIDEEVLAEIAAMTGGKYFRATDKEKLAEVYNEIDRLEKTKFEEKSYVKKVEEFVPFALMAGVLLLLEVLLRYTIFRTIP